MTTGCLAKEVNERFSSKNKISDEDLKKAITQIESGTIDADLGSGIIKQRIARKGQGKSGGYRSIIAFKKDDKAFFVYGFAKTDRGNIDKEELSAFKKAAKELLNLSDDYIDKLLKNKKLVEIKE